MTLYLIFKGTNAPKRLAGEAVNASQALVERELESATGYSKATIATALHLGKGQAIIRPPGPDQLWLIETDHDAKED